MLDFVIYYKCIYQNNGPLPITYCTTSIPILGTYKDLPGQTFP